MGCVKILDNPLKPTECSLHEPAVGLTVREWLDGKYPGFEDFDLPTVCFFNGQPILRKDWATTLISEGDVVVFKAVPGDVGSIIYGIIDFVVAYWVEITVVASLAYSLAAASGVPDLKGLPEPDSVHSLQGQRNKNRYGYPIPSLYGRNKKHYPDYAMPFYTRYSGNDQFLFQLFCIGQGEYEIHGISIEDTPIDNFEEATYQIVNPGETFTLFGTNYETSPEVGGIELYASNEPEYTGVSGPFVANAAFTETTLIECDVVLPQGLYQAQDDGTLGYRSVSATFEKREIDDTGAAISGWTDLVTFSRNRKTTTPQRYTIAGVVTAGRWEIRASRNTAKVTGDEAHKTRDKIVWQGMRAKLANVNQWDDQTILAVKMRATNNLNNQSQSRVNVDCTRKLPIYNGSTWSANTSTRNPAWAFCDVWKAKYGGQDTDDRLDLDAMVAIASEFTSDGINFDFAFDNATTVWEASELIAGACMCKAIRRGSKASLVREEAQSLASGVFSKENILPGSFRWEKRFAASEDFDSVDLYYIDEDTGEEEYLVCKETADTHLRPRTVKLYGQGNRDWAWRIGMRQRMRDKYIKDSYSFTTGKEGIIPDYGSRILVSHDVPRWGQYGLVETFDGTTAQLSKELDWSAGGTKQIIFRKKDGSESGPHTVTQGSDASIVVLDTPIGTSDFFLDDSAEPPFFVFGVSGEVGKAMILRKASKSGDENVGIEAEPYDTRLFSYDSTDAPPLGQPENSQLESPLPVVGWIEATPSPFNSGLLQVTWMQVEGAKSYVLEQSVDGTNWDQVTITQETLVTIENPRALTYLRVAAFNVDRGPWATWSGDTGSPVPVGPTVLDAEPQIGGVFLKWIQSSDFNRLRSLVYISTSATTPAKTAYDYEVDGNTITIGNLTPGQTYYAWVRTQNEDLKISDDVAGSVSFIPLSESSATSADAIQANASGYTFAADSSGNITDSLSLGDTTVELFVGLTKKTYAASPTNDRWRFGTISATNVTRNTGLTAPTVGITAMSGDSGYLLVPCIYRDDSGVDSDPFTVKINYAKQKSGSDGASAVIALLSNETHSVPTDKDGNNGNFTGAATTMTIYVGGTDDTSNWSISRSAVNCTTSLVDDTVTVTAMSADSAYVDITATRSGFSDQVKRFSLSKTRAGTDGDPGASAKVVALTASSQTFSYPNDGGAPSPTSITFTAAGQNLSGSPTFTVESGTATLTGTGTTRTLTYGNLSTQQATIKVTWDGQVDRVSVAKVFDGNDGDPGEDGQTQYTLAAGPGAIIDGRSIQKVSGSNGFNAGGYSHEAFVGGAFASFTPNATSDAAYVGLGYTVGDTTPQYAWRLHETSGARPAIDGTETGSYEAFTTSDVFSVVYDGASVKWLKNGVVKHTTTATRNEKFFFVGYLYYIGDRINNIAFGPAGERGEDGVSPLVESSESSGGSYANGSWAVLNSMPVPAGTWTILYDASGSGGGGGSGTISITGQLRVRLGGTTLDTDSDSDTASGSVSFTNELRGSKTQTIGSASTLYLEGQYTISGTGASGSGGGGGTLTIIENLGS